MKKLLLMIFPILISACYIKADNVEIEGSPSPSFRLTSYDLDEMLFPGQVFEHFSSNEKPLSDYYGNVVLVGSESELEMALDTREPTLIELTSSFSIRSPKEIYSNTLIRSANGSKLYFDGGEFRLRGRGYRKSYCDLESSTWESFDTSLKIEVEIDRLHIRSEFPVHISIAAEHLKKSEMRLDLASQSLVFVKDMIDLTITGWAPETWFAILSSDVEFNGVNPKRIAAVDSTIYSPTSAEYTSANQICFDRFTYNASYWMTNRGESKFSQQWNCADWFTLSENWRRCGRSQ